MSEALSDEAAPDETPFPSATVPDRFPIPFARFAASLKPRQVQLVRGGKPVIFKGRPVMTVTQGHVDEVWLKLLKMNHGTERHTAEEWIALIDTYREQPAHASDSRMTQ